ncbi:MAG: methionine adenosyltransferase [Gammaproteobacteria bacterium]|nr:methionine adenosyltransferase [Gammaproteobacteria bacterium]
MTQIEAVDFIFTSEAVTPGHPDKLCDLISDAVLDCYLVQDPASRMVAECAVSSGVIFLATRIASEVNIDIAGAVREVVAEAGYSSGDFNATDCSVMLSQGPFLSYALPRFDLQALDEPEFDRITASNQVTVFGYACRQTPSLMPLPIILANRLVRRLDEVRANGELGYLTPDCQAQAAVGFRAGEAVNIASINVLATQQSERQPGEKQLRDDLIEAVVKPVIAGFEIARGFDFTRLVVNPKGAMVGGGPVAHSGMTGRKTGMDTYGEFARQSGAALSGKDPIRIDRIGAYAARYVAKHVVAAEFAPECEVQLSYGVEQAQPLSLRVRGFGQGKLDDAEIARRVMQVFDLRPAAIARAMNLQQLPRERGGFYRGLAVYGHMGREDLDVPWERLDRLQQLKSI